MSQEALRRACAFQQCATSSQQRNLKTVRQIRTVERTGLILDIFAQRAQSFERKLPGRVSPMKRFATCLVRGWAHLERQLGGIELQDPGPSETQLEIDKRLISKRIVQIQKRLEKVEKRRSQG
jgi:GTP-binding protein HflX